jgi:hypothetical protein
MPDDKPIPLEATIVYQQAVTRAIYRALTATHGTGFADSFLHEYHDTIARATRTHLCGRSEASILGHTRILDRAYHGL